MLTEVHTSAEVGAYLFPRACKAQVEQKITGKGPSCQGDQPSGHMG